MEKNDKGRDLGTYHVLLDFGSSGAIVQEWQTGARFTLGSGGISPWHGRRLPPSWEDETSLVETIIYMWTEGNYSCDCNRSMFIARANGLNDPEAECGDCINLVSISIMRPNSDLWVKIWEG